MNNLTHQYIDRATGSVANERLLADKLIRFAQFSDMECRCCLIPRNEWKWMIGCDVDHEAHACKTFSIQMKCISGM